MELPLAAVVLDREAAVAHCDRCGWTWSGADVREAERRALMHAASCPARPPRPATAPR